MKVSAIKIKKINNNNNNNNNNNDQEECNARGSIQETENIKVYE
jgi:hypothetical protein